MTSISTISETVGLVEVHDDQGALLTVLHPTVDVVQIITAELIGPPGPAGVQGEIGDNGPAGPQGPFAPTFEMRFVSPLLQWVLNHNLNVYPVVNTYDLDGNEISGDVSMPDRNTVIVDFVVPIAGIAILKA